MSGDDAILAPADEDRFWVGYDAAWCEYEPGHPVGDPVGTDDDYRGGWWSGVGDCSAWHEGWTAAERGLSVCPYIIGADDECFREPWLDGYGSASLRQCRPAAAGRMAS